MKFELKNSELEIPTIGFGTWQLQGDVAYESTLNALEAGYKHIDTAEIYGNHKEVGKAIKDFGIKREDLFLTTKLWRTDFAPENVRPAIEKALKDLDQDYLDLYLIHWPDSNMNMEKILERFHAFKEEGLVKSYGVSNFTINHLEKLSDNFEIDVNQVEFHPSLYQKELLEYCKQNDILLTAYSPIAQGQDLKLDVIQNLAEKYDRSVAQIVLNWMISKEIVVIPRSSSKDHIQDNFGAQDFEMDDDDLVSIDELNTNNRLINPPFGEFGV